MARAWVAAFAIFVLGVSVAAAAESGTVKGTLRMGKEPVADAVVSLVGGGPAPSPAPPSANATMQQIDGRFIPHILAVPVGTKVEFANHDRVWHDVFSPSKPKKFDLGAYQPGESRSVTFDKPGVVRVLCNVHPKMEAFIVVEDTPLFAATDASGGYRIDGVAAGKYRLEVWRPGGKKSETAIELTHPGQVLDLDIDLARR